MKFTNFLILIISFSFLSIGFTSCLTGNHLDGTSYGKNYKHTTDKYQRAGYNCEGAVIVFKNNTESEIEIVIEESGVDNKVKALTSEWTYKKYVLNPKAKTEIKVKAGYNIVSDSFDEVEIDCYRCGRFVQVYNTKP